MNFELSDEQQALRDTAKSLLAVRWPTGETLRALDSPPATIPPPLWTEISTLGWPGIAVAPEVGGGGADLVTAAVVIEEAGRSVLPGPLLPVMVAAIALDRSGQDSLRKKILPEVCGGSSRPTIAIEEPAGSWGPEGVKLEAAKKADGWVLNGTKFLVPDAAGSDVILVAARAGASTALFAVPADHVGVKITLMSRLDGQSIAEVRLEEVRVDWDETSDAEGIVQFACNLWSLLCAADLLGVAGRVLELTNEYAKQRVQFGRLIGAFQAVSHRLADMLVDVEIGRGLVYGACLALEESRPEAPALVSSAKAWMSDAATRVAEAGIQLHGGIGYTWELGLHLYLRRARANAATAGTADHHRDRVASWMERDFRKESDEEPARVLQS